MKTALLTLALAVAHMTPSETQAQPAQTQNQGEGKEQKEMMRQQMARAHTIMTSKLVAASDGGVFLLIGNSLRKYDDDLSLQKQVEIQLSTEETQQMMYGKGHGYGTCDMCGGKAAKENR